MTWECWTCIAQQSRKFGLMSLGDLSKKIGYEFADIKLLELATHKSADSKSNNERLEFLGDAILSTLFQNICTQNSLIRRV